MNTRFQKQVAKGGTISTKPCVHVASRERSPLRHILYVAAILGVSLGVTVAHAGTFTWKSVAVDNNWENPANWDLSGVDDGANGFPDGTDTARPVGNSNITLVNIPNPLAVAQIYWLTGDGSFELTGSQIDTPAIRKDRVGTFTVNNDLLVTGNTNSQAFNTGAIELKGTISGTGAIRPSGGTTEIFGDNTNTGALGMNGTTNVILRHVNALGVGTGQTEMFGGSVLPTFSLASDAGYSGVLRITNSGDTLGFRIVESGANDRTFTYGNGTTTHLGSIALLANEVGSTGDLTLRWLKDDGGTQSVHRPISTLSNSIVQLDTTLGTSVVQLVSGAVISGDGSLLKTGIGRGEVELAQTYTGGTQISGGTLQLDGAGQLPDTGPVNVASGATFDLNDITDTIGSLTGTGDVELGASPANTLTIAEGISPGNSAGTLTINELGTVELGASSVNMFELGPLAGPNDQVVFSSGANLTLGGTLDISDLGGLEDGDYVLFDLNGGTISGSFSTINLPFGFTGEILTNSGDVVLSTVFSIPEPSTVTLLGLGLLGLVSRRRKRSKRS